MTFAFLLVSCNEDEKETSSGTDSASAEADITRELYEKAGLEKQYDALKKIGDKMEDPQEKYDYFYKAKFTGGPYDGVSFRGQLPEQYGGQTNLIYREDKKREGYIEMSIGTLDDGVQTGDLSFYFEGEPALGKAKVRFKGSGGKNRASLGRISWGPTDEAKAKSGGSSVVVQFKEMDLEFTEFSEWEDYKRYPTVSDEYRNITGKATVTEYLPPVVKGSPSRRTGEGMVKARIDIEFMTLQKREKEGS